MLYFCYGVSPFLEFERDKLIEEITNENIGIKPVFFDCLIKEEEEFLVNLQTNSLFSNLDFLILRRAEILKNTGLQKIMKQIKKFSVENKIIIIEYNLPLQYDKPAAEFKLTQNSLNLIKELGKLIECDEKSSLNNIKKFIKNSINISEKDLEDLIKILGNDYYVIKNEIDKIKTFLSGESYSFDKIKNLLSIDKVTNVKDEIDYFLKTKDCKNINNYIKNNPQSIMSIIYMLGDEINNIIKILSLINLKTINIEMSYNEFKNIYPKIADNFISKNKTTQHSYVVYLKLKDCKNHSIKLLETKFRDLLYLEYQIKNGEKNSEIFLTYFLSNFFKN